MLSVAMSKEELAALVRALESYLPDLTTERIGTDNRQWHAELKGLEAILGALLKRLQSLNS